MFIRPVNSGPRAMLNFSAAAAASVSSVSAVAAICLRAVATFSPAVADVVERILDLLQFTPDGR